MLKPGDCVIMTEYPYKQGLVVGFGEGQSGEEIVLIQDPLTGKHYEAPITDVHSIGFGQQGIYRK